ncbi:MAG: hypothetical protein ABI890_09210, partial [Lapillicoccus sp.]
GVTSPRTGGSGGFGLRSMASRAAELGGVLTLESQPGRGTAVSVLFHRSADVTPAATTPAATPSTPEAAATGTARGLP